MILNLMLCRCLFLVVCMGLFTGCWDRRETDDLALVIASGLDLAEDGQIEATLQIALPTGIPSSLQSGGGGKKSVLVLSATGKSGVDVLGKMQQQLSRKIFLGHRGVMIIGEKYARHGIDRVMDSIMRLSESRYNSYILTADGTTAKEILNTPYELEQIPGVGINKIQFNESSLAVKSDEFLSSLASDGSAPVTGGIRLKKNGTGQPTIIIDKAAVYNGNKLAGFLSGMELATFRWLKGEPQKLRFSTQMELEDDKAKGIVAIEILQANSKIRTVIKKGAPEVEVSLKARARLMENDTKLDLSNAKHLKEAEAKFAKDVQKSVEKLIAQVQKKYSSDIFGFGREIHIQHPYAWKSIKKEWKDIFPRVPVTVKTDIRIERLGRTQAPAHLKKPGQ